MRSSRSATVAFSLLLFAGGQGLLGGCEGSLDIGPAGTGPSCAICVGESEMSRVTRLEYELAVRAALGASVDEVRFDYLPADGTAGPFASNAFLDVDDDGVEAYRLVAEAIGAAAQPEADAVLGCTASSASVSCVSTFVDRLGGHLFRRALTTEERAPYLALFEETRTTESGADAVRLVITAMLQSVHFLYRPEIGTPTEVPDVVELTGPELASRLAAFLWRASPDEALLEAAASGELASAEGVMAEARRMLADPRADVTIARFHTSWLGMGHLSTRNVDPGEFPDFEALRGDMLDETGAFAVHVFRDRDATLATLLTADYTVASPALAAFYGADAPGADGVVDLDPEQRSGVLTQAGFLASHTTSASSAGVHRGRVIREGFLCQPMPSPPPIDLVIAPDPTLSSRQQLEQKTSPDTCATCHVLMNPAGFLFEHYDPIGRFRERDGTFAVDATGEVVESDLEGPLDGAVELADALSTSEDVQRCVARQWARYALGRGETDADERSLRVAYARYVDAGRDLRELIVALTGTDSFRYRRIPQE